MLVRKDRVQEESISEVETISTKGRAHLLLPPTEQPFQCLHRLHLDITIQQRCSGNEDIEADPTEDGESRRIGFLEDEEEDVPWQSNSRRRRLDELERTNTSEIQDKGGLSARWEKSYSPEASYDE